MAERLPGLIVRPMTEGDVQRVLEIAARTAQAPHWPRAAYLTALDAQATPRRIALVAEIDARWNPSATSAEIPLCAADKAQGEDREGLAPPSGLAVVAFAVASVVAPQAELESIAVDASARRRGVAHALLAAIANVLCGLGATDLLLEVRASNQPALELYSGCGFEPVALRSRYYIDPVEDAVLMTARLN